MHPMSLFPYRKLLLMMLVTIAALLLILRAGAQDTISYQSSFSPRAPITKVLYNTQNLVNQPFFLDGGEAPVTLLEDDTTYVLMSITAYHLLADSIANQVNPWTFLFNAKPYAHLEILDSLSVSAIDPTNVDLKMAGELTPFIVFYASDTAVDADTLWGLSPTLRSNISTYHAYHVPISYAESSDSVPHAKLVNAFDVMAKYYFKGADTLYLSKTAYVTEIGVMWPMISDSAALVLNTSMYIEGATPTVYYGAHSPGLLTPWTTPSYYSEAVTVKALTLSQLPSAAVYSYVNAGHRVPFTSMKNLRILNHFLYSIP